jgi:hypothetical protein
MNSLKVISVLVLIIINTGCVSSWNHDRIQKSMIAEREEAIKTSIKASGNADQIKFVSMGVKPSDVIKISPTKDFNGAMLLVDLFKIDEIPGYFKTFADSPVSSSASLASDGLIAYLSFLGGKSVYDKYISGNNSANEIVNITINGDNNYVDYKNSGSQMNEVKSTTKTSTGVTR